MGTVSTFQNWTSTVRVLIRPSGPSNPWDVFSNVSWFAPRTTIIVLRCFTMSELIRILYGFIKTYQNPCPSPTEGDPTTHPRPPTSTSSTSSCPAASQLRTRELVELRRLLEGDTRRPGPARIGEKRRGSGASLEKVGARGRRQGSNYGTGGDGAFGALGFLRLGRLSVAFGA